MITQSKTLYVIASPLGNLADISLRAIEIFSSVDFWIVEDTRISGKLLSHFNLQKSMCVMNEHTRPDKIYSFIQMLQNGQSAVLITDAGTPGISDPGAALIDLCYAENIFVDAIPGASAVTTALMLSGFFAQRFCFFGFLGRKSGSIKSDLLPFKDSTMSLVFFESPYRVEKLLQIASEVLGSRRYAICREMTKLFQQVYRDTLPCLPTIDQVPHKGEFTIVIEGKRRIQKNELI